MNFLSVDNYHWTKLMALQSRTAIKKEQEPKPVFTHYSGKQ